MTAPTTAETDCAFLLRILSDGEPHSLNEILQRSFAERGCGLTVHSRAANLREARHGGHVINNWKDGRRGDGSWYQLVETSGAENERDVVGASPFSAPDTSATHDSPRAGSPDGEVSEPIPGQITLDFEAAA